MGGEKEQMKLFLNILKQLAINLVLIFSVFGVFTTGPFIIEQAYHLFTPKSPLVPMAANWERYSWHKDYLNDWKKLHREYKDYVVWRLKPLSGATINISQNGVRQTKPCEVIEYKNPRYLFFGSSIIWGAGSPDTLTIPSIFAEINRAETVNYALGGYEVRQCVASLLNLYIENKITDKKNTIIFLNGLMEAYNQFKHPQFELATPNQNAIREATGSPVLGAAYLFRPAVHMMGKISLKINRSKSREQVPADIEKAAEFAADTTVRSWLAVARLAEGYNDDFVAVLPPFYAIGHPNLKQLPTICSQDHMDFIRTVYNLISAKVARYPEIKFIDLTDIFDGPMPIYMDQFGHYLPEGNRIFAEQLTKRLAALNSE